jgi:hypothetical protein
MLFANRISLSISCSIRLLETRRPSPREASSVTVFKVATLSESAVLLHGERKMPGRQSIQNASNSTTSMRRVTLVCVTQSGRRGDWIRADGQILATREDSAVNTSETEINDAPS